MNSYNLKDCNSTEQNTNNEIAKNENLIYSSKYNLFFDRFENKSRYIESLYRQEHDLRTEDEIAKEAGVIYWKGMFFEDDKDVELYLQQTQSVEKRLTDDVLPADIVKADIKMRISYSMIENKFFIFFCTTIAVIAGAISFTHTPVDAFPDVTNTKVTIITQWPGRSAE